MQKVLNERITKDKVPCYYWSLKTVVMDNFYDQFMRSFGIGDAINRGILAGCSGDTLSSVLRRLKEETGAPCVLVLDDAQVCYLNNECHTQSIHNKLYLFSSCSRVRRVLM